MTPIASGDMWDEIAPARSVWVITLADLALLLVGFFVLLQANRELDRATLLAGLRAGFGIEEAVVPPMAVAAARVEGFAEGSAVADMSGAILWARGAARDPRTRIAITGSAEGARDIDPATGSAAILAADRARTVAAALVRSGAADPARISIVTDPGKRRAVILSVGFAGTN
ncbi:flagellar motor protein MotB [Sphingomonas sp. BT-65]|uniref:flagellar motor protein MotB n=1 Tax=Sphingomonas sp. BT-65 TaxID=2989821 RepID=UPI002236BD3D|nr:flagellar motor protein MotB [Sphingomonas sp. BT-65]MCW4462489.1 flagellar motor protein MotB [Sphingomonas sp. BT-65]